jgi:hypothetical protein
MGLQVSFLKQPTEIKILTIFGGCDYSSGGSPRVAFSNVMELANLPNFPHAIVGPKTSREAQAMSMAATNFGMIPIVSNWATSPRLASKSLFPTFARTIPSDTSGAKFAAYLARKLGYKRIGFMHESSDWGAGFKDALFTESSKLDIIMKFSAYDSGNQVSTSQAMRTMKQSKLNVIFVANFMDDLRELAEAWKAEGMNTQPTLFIFIALESYDALTIRISGDQNYPPNDDIAKMMHGSLSFTFSVFPNTQWSNFLDKFSQGDFTKYESRVSDMFPPNGLGNTDQGCANSNYSYPLTSGYLGASKAQLNQDVWAWTFDQVLAVGLAICQLRPTDPLPSTLDSSFGEQLYNKIINLDFKGLSGEVNFNTETGDRSPNSADYVLYNYKRVTEFEIQPLVLGAWMAQLDDWKIDISSATFKSGIGKPPTETVAPEEDFTYLPLGLKVLGYIEVIFLNLLCLGSIAWVAINRHDKVVINAQGVLLALMTFGCMIASWSILALTADDQLTDVLDESVSCMVAPVMFSFGFQLALVALIAKIYRIYILFKASTRLKLKRVSLPHVLKVISFFMAGETVILVLWICIAPLKFTRLVSQVDEYGNTKVSFGQCSGDAASVAFVLVVFALHAVAVILTYSASNHVRELPTKYQESRYLNMAILSMAQIYLIAVPSIAAVYSTPIGRFVITSSTVFVTIGALLFFMIFPKIFPKQFGMEGTEKAVAVVAEEHPPRNYQQQQQDHANDYRSSWAKSTPVTQTPPEQEDSQRTEVVAHISAVDPTA